MVKTTPKKPGQTKKTNALAIVGFIFSFVLPLIGLVLAIIALNQLKKNPEEEGKGFAIAAIVISSFFLLLILLFILFLLFTVGLIASILIPLAAYAPTVG